MGLLSSIKNLLNPVDGLISGAKDIISLIKGDLSPEKQAEVNVKMAMLEAEAEREKRAYDLKLEELYVADAASLRDQIKVELASEDPFVRRARPAWLWGLLVMYLVNYPVTAIVSWFVEGVAPMDIPWEVHALATTLVGGYGLLRSIEKTGNKPPFSR